MSSLKIGKYPIEEIDQPILKQMLALTWHEKAESAENAPNRRTSLCGTPLRSAYLSICKLP